MYNKDVVDMRGSHLALDCAVVDGLAARAEEVGEAVADHALGPRAAAALPPALSPTPSPAAPTAHQLRRARLGLR